MNKDSMIAVDIAKYSFQIHQAKENGQPIKKQKLSRNKFRDFLVKIEPTVVFMEACGTSNYWARFAESHGHEVKLIAPQYVKPYVKRQKNDAADAEAIFEAGTRKNMNFVPAKSVPQQDMQSVVRIRESLVKDKVNLSNQIRGLLGEYGVDIRKGDKFLNSHLAVLFDPNVKEIEKRDLSPLMIDCLKDLYFRFNEIIEEIAKYDKKIVQMNANNDLCKKVLEVPGIGPITAAALIAAVGNAAAFKNGRQLSAWLGLVPKQNSTGGKTNLGKLSKQGNKYLRTLLIHGGRSVLRWAKNRDDTFSQWANNLADRVGKNKAAVALANRNARIIWALLTKGVSFNPSYIGQSNK